MATSPPPSSFSRKVSSILLPPVKNLVLEPRCRPTHERLNATGDRRKLPRKSRVFAARRSKPHVTNPPQPSRVVGAGPLQALRRKAALAADVAAAKAFGQHRPLSLGWEITAACNAACVYCHFREPSAGELTTDEALRLVAEMAALGTRMVSISGGEPLLRGDLATVVDGLVDRGIAVSLNTNGFLVHRNEHVVRRAHRVKISIDGPEPIHDAVRGSGTFRRAVRAVELCQAWGVPVTVETVIGKTNLPHVEELLEWCGERRLRVQLQPARAAIFHGGEPNPERPDAVALGQLLERLATGKHHSLLLNTPQGLRHIARFPTPTPMACASGQITARITSTGIFKLCGEPPAHAPEASWRELGLQEAFRRLRPVACDACWCAPRVDVNLAYQGRNLLSFARGRAAGILSPSRSSRQPR